MAEGRRTGDGTAKPPTAAAKAAAAAGFEEWHTGGGLMAFRKDGDGRYWLVTDGDGGTEADPDAAVWTVGCYSDDDADDDGRYDWTFVEEGVTLAQALELHDRMPDPDEPERTVASWSDLGMEVAPASRPRRR